MYGTAFTFIHLQTRLREDEVLQFDLTFVRRILKMFLHSLCSDTAEKFYS
jgi:hypothetical protein